LAFFTANRENSAFIIIMGLLPGSNMLIGLRLFSDSNNNFPAAPFFVQGIMATAFGIIFFASTWAKLPIQTVHETRRRKGTEFFVSRKARKGARTQRF
jgi:hypothetical protein